MSETPSRNPYTTALWTIAILMVTLAVVAWSLSLGALDNMAGDIARVVLTDVSRVLLAGGFFALLTALLLSGLRWQRDHH